MAANKTAKFHALLFFHTSFRHLANLGPPVVPFYSFFGEGSPTKIDYRRKGTLILTPPCVEISAAATWIPSMPGVPGVAPGAGPRLPGGGALRFRPNKVVPGADGGLTPKGKATRGLGRWGLVSKGYAGFGLPCYLQGSHLRPRFLSHPRDMARFLAKAVRFLGLF